MIEECNRANYVAILYKNWLFITCSHLLQVDDYEYDALANACLFVYQLKQKKNTNIFHTKI